MTKSSKLPHRVSRRQVLANLTHASLGAGVAGGLGLTPRLTSAKSANRSSKPNILFIVTDQERSWMDLPSQLDLPAHQYLLESGTGFENYYVNTSPCSPSRSVIYSGRHTMDTGITANLGAPPFPKFNSDVATLGHYLRDAGYYTAYKGKWHLSEVEDAPGLIYNNYPSQHQALEAFGFSDFNLTGDYHGSVWTGRKADSLIASEAKFWLERKAAQMEQPWCLAVNFVNPHDVMFYSSGVQQERSRLSENFLAPLRPEPAHPLYKKDWSHMGLPNSFNADLSAKPWAHQSFKGIVDQLFGEISTADEELWLNNQSYYFNCIRDVSRQAFEVINTLKSIGQLDNTIIIYTADHGEMAGAHGLRQKGPTIYKENSRVPLIIKHPDIAGGSSTNQLASAVDLVPTILDMIGVTPDESLVGHSLSNALSNTQTERDRQGLLFAYGVLLYSDPDFMAEVIRSGKGATASGLLSSSLKQGSFGPSLENRALHRGIFDGRYKFARYFAPNSHHIPTDWETLIKHNDLELYDTHEDPDELTNLAANPEQHKSLLLSLNEKTNELINREIGEDLGKEFVGPQFLYSL